MRGIFLVAMALNFLGPVAQAAPKTLVYCSEANPMAINSILSSDLTSQDVSRHLFGSLVEFKTGSAEVEPWIAKSWKISKDGLRYTFKLRSGIKFHTTEYFTPTRELKAEDVVYSFERFMNKDHPYHLVGGGVYPIVSTFGFATLVTSVKAIDPLTVELTLAHPFTPFLTWLGAKAVFAVFSKEYAEKLLAEGKTDHFDQFPIGSGPFVFKSFVKDSQITMTAFAEHFRGKPAIDKLVFVITPDSSIRVSKVKTGECQVAFQPAPADLASISSHPHSRIVTGTGSNIAYLSFNTSKAPFDKPEVRRAVALALNRDSYIDAVYLGNGEVLDAPIPKLSWAYLPASPVLNTNIAEAKRLLAAAGFPDGFKTTLLAMPVSRPYNPNGKKMAELMQSDLAKAGIEVKIEQYEWATHLSKTKTGDYEMAQLGWNSRTGDPDGFLHGSLSCDGVKSGANRARWCNPKFDELIAKGRETLDQGKRRKIYLESQRIFHAHVPWAMLASGKIYHLISDNVRGFKTSPDGSVNFYGVSVE